MNQKRKPEFGYKTPSQLCSTRTVLEPSTMNKMRLSEKNVAGFDQWPTDPSCFIPRQTRGRPVRQVAAWLQTPERETSYRCRSPGWFLRLPSGPWRRHSAGRDSCSGGRWAGLGYLFVTKGTQAQSEDAPCTRQCGWTMEEVMWSRHQGDASVILWKWTKVGVFFCFCSNVKCTTLTWLNLRVYS